MSNKLKAAILAFEDFLNEPPQYEDKRMVREYRHEAYRKWSELRDQITAALPAQEWQDISTAPKDGTRILLFDKRWKPDDRERVIGHWYTHPCVTGWISDEVDCGDYDFSPTHWMPLPAPPVAIIADDRGNQNGEHS